MTREHGVPESRRRESVEEKARRLLVDGRLVVRHVDGGGVRASCRGDSGVHELVVEGGVASCSCPARQARCSHVVALELVVDPEPVL